MTETQTVDLAAWLTQIWDEEERLAKAVQQPHVWHQGDHSDEWSQSEMVFMWPPEFHTPYEQDKHWRGEQVSTPALAAHIAYHDPASVLARIAADRKILELHSYHMASSLDSHFQRIPGSEHPCCDTCASQDENGERWPCETVRLLASPYKGREGWQEAWGNE